METGLTASARLEDFVRMIMEAVIRTLIALVIFKTILSVNMIYKWQTNTCIFDYTVYAERTIQCTCRRGFTGSGYGMRGCVPTETNSDPCTDNPCGLHGQCVTIGNNNYSCSCSPQYTGYTFYIRQFNNLY